MGNTVLKSGKETLIIFSKNKVIKQLNSLEVDKLSRIFSLLQDVTEEMEDAKREMLYGPLVDAFEMESYFTDEDISHDVNPRNLEIIEDNNREFDNTTVITFGYLNSKDLYIQPEELEILQEDLAWFMDESGKCKKETKEFVSSLVSEISNELTYIKNNFPTNGYVVKNP